MDKKEIVFPSAKEGSWMHGIVFVKSKFVQFAKLRSKNIVKAFINSANQ